MSQYVGSSSSMDRKSSPIGTAVSVSLSTSLVVTEVSVKSGISELESSDSIWKTFVVVEKSALLDHMINS